MKPSVEIVIGPDSAACRVVVNGQDITRSLEGFHVACRAGQQPAATLFVRKGHLQATKAVIADVTVVEEVDPAATDDRRV